MPVHVAITRRVLPGREEEFQRSLREFFRTSFAHDGVLGATMLAPAPGSGSREFGILRTFADRHERDRFYASPLFLAWQEQCRPLTEDGTWSCRELHGLEAWFRSPRNPPPRWKMAVTTFLGVLPVALGLNLALGPSLRRLPLLVGTALFNLGVVALLTWVVMPLLTRAMGGWLHPAPGNAPGSPSETPKDASSPGPALSGPPDPRKDTP